MEENNTIVNPQSALEALFPQTIDCGNGVEVRPFSLATYALLEKIKSYIVFPHEPDQEEILKSLYICTHDPKEIYKKFDSLGEEAFGWAETLPPYMVETITQAVLKQIKAVRDAMPPPKAGDEKKAVTDG